MVVKNIIMLIVLIIISLNSFCQYPVTDKGWNEIKYPQNPITYPIYNSYLDTTQANKGVLRTIAGSIIYTLDSTSIWVRSKIFDKWIKLMPSKPLYKL